MSKQPDELQTKLAIPEPEKITKTIDDRLAEAEYPQDIVLWTRVREEVGRQEEQKKSAEHKRRLEVLQFYFKAGFSVVVFATGIILLIYQYFYLAPLILGAALFILAPEFIMAYLTRGEDESDGNS
jgi:hypothetical protein